MSEKPRIAIVGAGLGGITAGIFLERAGYRVAIYEQAGEIARIGAGINLGANAMKVTRKIGLAEMMYDIGLIPQRHLSREWDTGRVLFEIRPEPWAERYGMPNLIMHRGDLQAVMASALAAGTIRFDKHLLGLRHGPGGVWLEFADSTTAEADIVIGADGVDSRVREILFGVEPPIYTGVVAYRAIFPTALLGAKGLTSDMSKWWSDERHPAAEDRHFIIYHLTRRRDEVYFVTGSPEPDWDDGIASIPVDMAEIRACYEGFHPEVLRVIDACPQASKWPLLVRPPMKSWSEGPIVLLGDACHPMKPHMGQGANMAIEDAVVLARCLDHCAGEAVTASRLYQATRRERVERVQRESYVNVWLKYPTDPTWVFGYDPMTAPLATTKEDA
jgi:6-hydroxynicotinate 3-monooxygenase